MLISRRDFLKKFSAGALSIAVVPALLSSSQDNAPSFYRFTDNIKEAKISSPLSTRNLRKLRKVAERYKNRDLSFGDKTFPFINKVKIAGELRTALFAPAPSSYAFSVQIPQKAVLSFGYALMPEAWQLSGNTTLFRILLYDGNGKKHLLFSEEIAPQNQEDERKWFDERVDLSSQAGEHVDIIFETVASNSALDKSILSDYAIWSTPLLYSTDSLPSKPNIVFISLDSLRADHLSCYGYHRKTTPNIDKLAKSGFKFLNAFSPTCWTIPAHCSMLTGKLPHNHGGTVDSSKLNWQWYPLSSSQLTLAEILRENGFLTAGFTGGGYMGDRNGLHQGFDIYYDNAVQGSLGWLNIERSFGKISSFLERNHDLPNPFLLFFHTFEPHAPYTRGYFVTDDMERGRFGDAIRFHSESSQKKIKTATSEEKAYAIARYDSDIHYADMYVGKLIEKLKQFNLLSNTLIVLTSDHGQDLWDHYPQRSCYHAHSLYDELIHVPLIIVPKGGIKEGQTFENQVRIQDIFPTILSMLSIDYDPQSIDGTSLLPLLKGEKASLDLPAYGEDTHCGPERKSIRTKRYKYIYVPDLTQVREGYTGVNFYEKDVLVLSPIRQEELYDLENDPHERHNLASAVPKFTEKLRKKVREVFSIKTAKLLEMEDGRERIRLEGFQKPIEKATVKPYLSRKWSIIWSTLDGSLQVIDEEGEYVILSFETPIKGGAPLYLIQVEYSDKYSAKMVEKMTVERQIPPEQKASEKEKEDSILIKQLKSLGYM